MGKSKNNKNYDDLSWEDILYNMTRLISIGQESSRHDFHENLDLKSRNVFSVFDFQMSLIRQNGYMPGNRILFGCMFGEAIRLQLNGTWKLNQQGLTVVCDWPEGNYVVCPFIKVDKFFDNGIEESLDSFVDFLELMNLDSQALERLSYEGTMVLKNGHMVELIKNSDGSVEITIFK